jgi:hypothetical protein
MTQIEFSSEDAIWIGGTLHCMTPDSLEVVKAKLTELGYSLRDLRSDEERSKRERPISVEEMENAKVYLWFATLNDIRFGKCDSCGARISYRGIERHGHTCEACGAVTYYEIVEDTKVRFRFRGDDSFMGPDVCFRALFWDADASWLYLKPEPQQWGMFTATGDKAAAYMSSFTDQWSLVDYNGQQAIKVFYPRRSLEPYVPGISVADIGYGMRNFKIINVWQDVEYGQYDNKFPVPDMIHIYETWRWAPLEPSPTLFVDVLSSAGQTSDPYYHYQDGRQAISVGKYYVMGKFIRYCTTLDADLWDQLVPSFPLDGPGSIYAVASFCHPDSQVKGTPNIGNTLSVMAGLDKSRAGLVAGVQALADERDARQLIFAMHSRLLNT